MGGRAHKTASVEAPAASAWPRPHGGQRVGARASALSVERAIARDTRRRGPWLGNGLACFPPPGLRTWLHKAGRA